MKPKLRIKNLIFDIGGVIILRRKLNFLKFDKKFSLKKGTTEMVLRDCLTRLAVDKDFDEKSFLQENFSQSMSWYDYQKIMEDIHKGERLNRGLLNWIQRKKEKHKIFILSNNTIALEFLLREKFKIHHLFDDLFDHVFISAEIGLAKPDPKIFEHVLKRLKAEPEECLFVDDNPENIKSAEKLGFHTILFTSNKDFFEKLNKK